MKIDDPNAAPTVAKTIDDQFRNSTAPTKTGTEKAFAAGFASMWGNVKLLMSTIGMAVVFAILLVTANAMMMNQRERTSRGGGDEDGRLLRPAGVRAGHHRGRGDRAHRRGARARRGGDAARSSPASARADSSRASTSRRAPSLVGAAVALLLTVASGVFPAWQAAKLPVVQALRRVE